VNRDGGAEIPTQGGAVASDAETGAPLEPLTRWLDERLAAGDEGRLLGRGYQGSIHLFASPFGEVVIKQAPAAGLAGFLGRRTLRREARIYDKLQGVPGIPRCFGLIRGRYLALEHIAGPSLRVFADPFADRDRFYARLLRTLDAMHAAGVAHGDLKRKNNILVGPGEQPYVIDFGIAWRLTPRSPVWKRRIFAWIEQIDYNAWIKHKYGRAPQALTAEDGARYRPLLLERAARAIRIPWQTITLRRLRKRLRDPARDRSRFGS
jgi:predicted Ser/Thr protein kinase